MLLVLGQTVFSGVHIPYPQYSNQNNIRCAQSNPIHEWEKVPIHFCPQPKCTYKSRFKGNLKRHMKTRHGLDLTTMISY